MLLFSGLSGGGWRLAMGVLMVGAMSLGALASPATYIINPGDILRIDVWNEADLSREVLVRPDGYITFPMVGDVKTAHSTPAQVGHAISSALGQYMNETPPVVVSLVSTNGNKIYVIGKVNEPGEFLITGNTDVMQALALAGGLNAFAKENSIVILRRRADGTQVAIPFQYEKVKEGKQLESNIILDSRDVIVVP
ncbi:polysaccharide biosynthesis/export family protein [Parahaliea mediterranea]|uniref:Polysaccharide biosynthesis/export family protein n=1 Tax=Parahaliea mediterranea TaxID=651086 RepID=A0A939DBS7_9GAMM|nr:polysaccharide biosynthesis/export family protein [Parahaliea mediterranea]MBN7795261.1 polysaccharide biosynthesis/export family protein [Parahaliea mediterranea]